MVYSGHYDQYGKGCAGARPGGNNDRQSALKRMDFARSEVDEEGGSRREPELTGLNNPEHREISGSLPGVGHHR